MRLNVHRGRLVLLLVSALGVATVAGVAGAQEGPAAAPASETSACGQDPAATPSSTATSPQLHTFALPEHSVVIDVPTSHELAGSDGLWYVVGELDGEATVPDVRVQFMAGDSLEDAVSEAFPGSTMTPVGRRYVDGLILVTTPSRFADGTPVDVARYVLPVEGGVIIVERYEQFDWACFDLVGRSLRSYGTVD